MAISRTAKPLKSVLLFLLYYLLPCLQGLLSAYTEYYACLVEAIYVILGDRISV